ncbi:MAG: helix-turn-helix domain-containing protein [Planctomycetota bacterium]|nr:MAG: helix-turn-helix domain-containing protein [Planctomycetota bacterium]
MIHNIGMEIKILRERKGVTGKELAEKIDLSQSQMSRLEKGQRRIDTKTLAKIAEALDVKPSFFFKEDEEELKDINIALVNRNIGRLIRKRRRERHLTPEELASKVGKTKSYINEIENGNLDFMTSELAKRICKVLKIEPTYFFETQQDTIDSLKQQVLRMQRAHADSTLGRILTDEEGEPVQRQSIPIINTLSSGYPTEFAKEGVPLGEVDDYIFLPRIDDKHAFAIYVIGDSMTQDQAPSFREGDIAAFASKVEIKSRDFVFARIEGERPTFRQVFFDPNGTIRLQPLNRNYAPSIFHREEIIDWWRLVGHIERF